MKNGECVVTGVTSAARLLRALAARRALMVCVWGVVMGALGGGARPQKVLDGGGVAGARCREERGRWRYICALGDS